MERSHHKGSGGKQRSKVKNPGDGGFYSQGKSVLPRIEKKRDTSSKYRLDGPAEVLKEKKVAKEGGGSSS